MKKRGFTLAEVLITLTIIGVVATMTLPALMTNTQEQQARTGLKKGINTFTEAGQMNLATEGWDFGTATAANGDGITNTMTEDEKNVMSFEALVANRVSVDFTKGIEMPTNLVTQALAGHRAVYFKDGSALYYVPGDAVATSGANNANMTLLEDGLPIGYVAFYDTNGMSGPNILSNCQGTTAGESEALTSTPDSVNDFVTAADAVTACTPKNARVIKDIFAIRLRGNVAQPEGEASTWIFGDVKATGAANPS